MTSYKPAELQRMEHNGRASVPCHELTPDEFTKFAADFKNGDIQFVKPMYDNHCMLFRRVEELDHGRLFFHYWVHTTMDAKTYSYGWGGYIPEFSIEGEPRMYEFHIHTYELPS